MDLLFTVDIVIHFNLMYLDREWQEAPCVLQSPVASSTRDHDTWLNPHPLVQRTQSKGMRG